MNKKENKLLKEEMYQETLKNGLKVIIIPKKNTNQKMAIIGTKFGSIDNHFIEPNSGREVTIPDGVAHFLEHKMFEQADGTNSLDTLTNLGVNANAYTTTDHTAYHFETTINFIPAFQELLNYVYHPYFTDENVEKEKGIIDQEIGMYDDDAGSKVFLNAYQCMYKNNPVRQDVAGTVQTVSKITKEILYDCTNTFYHPSNMVLVVCGNVDINEIMEIVKKDTPNRAKQNEIKRIYPNEPKEIFMKNEEIKMQVSMPRFVIGIKDGEFKNTKFGKGKFEDIKFETSEKEKKEAIQENSKQQNSPKIMNGTSEEEEQKIKRDLTNTILLNYLCNENSELYNKLYEYGDLFEELDFGYEYSDIYSHSLIYGISNNPEKVYEEFLEEIEKLANTGLNEEIFKRAKNKLYGKLILSFDDVSGLARTVMINELNKIDTFKYMEIMQKITLKDLEEELKRFYKRENCILSVVNVK